MNILSLIGRQFNLFDADIIAHSTALNDMVQQSRFLIIGGAGSIGQAVVREIFKRMPKVLHVVDISENNMVELVRDIRSTLGYINGDFQTFAIDYGSVEFLALLNSGYEYDYVLNLSALKHVRSEKDPFTLMRMIDVNITNVIRSIDLAKSMRAKKYFCVSTDKAANPVNMMGGSKRIMEMFLGRASLEIPISTARFANVAFSDGSLLYGFSQRILKRQPISAPNDVRRYFVTPQESGELCLMSCLLGQNRDIFFPKLNENLHLTTFSEIAIRYLSDIGFEAVECSTEEEARHRVLELIPQKKWPCYFFESDTTGEKDFEEFFTSSELLDMESFEGIGVIKNLATFDNGRLEHFIETLKLMRANKTWHKEEIVDLFNYMVPGFAHKETGKYLDQRM
ncbi:UDP-N-acetylglucosamine 4,6-dehydratase [Polynucleobacter tropicus]|uniref:UDP-N-acetylglucosamine 4,6-dehydratase n=1 Tax=Polynucleobacter tropicus TaxID=1743174 RepID=A0A6M9PZ83_9BURK|nr:UDP-N-acetylglucosamine 4,6-dehydratase [Polynucleobacter tropicus]QKM64065.1 UDP-N-acetylglucosamine 4,6-dehydratase [Polynucleobacter tropicus]